jgi:phosphatidylglycerophosphate synthase
VLEHAIGKLGLVGVNLPGSIGTDENIDAPRLEPLYARLEQLGVPIFLHPTDAMFTDILDGWTARRLGQVSHTGSVLDGWLDKVVHVNAAWTLVNAELMPNWWMACWFSRELIQGPMVIWLTGRFYRGEVGPHEATVVGKVTAWLLGVAMVAVALGLRGLGEVLTPIIGLCGAWSGFGYLWRELRDLRALSRRA